MAQFQKEAKDKGLTLISKVKNSPFYLYQFDQCGHKKEIKPSNLRKSDPVCQTCFIEKLKKEAIENGLLFISKGEKRDYYSYKFIECGHIKDFSAKNLRKRKTNIVCDTCLLDEYKNDAKSKGLTLISKIDNSEQFLYVFDKCGHEKKCHPKSVKNFNPVCSVCNLQTFEKEAEEKGLTICSKGEKRDHYIYKFNKCGHKKEYKPANIRVKNPICETCGDSHFHNDSNIYLLHIYNNENSFLKLGVANNIKTRTKQYNLDESYIIKKLNCIKLESKFSALEHEQNIHNVYFEQKLNPETMRNILSSGFTECYPFSLLNSLSNELKKIETMAALS